MSHLRTESYKSRGIRNASPKRQYNEVQPKAGLAYTPADMARMHANGMPVNSANLINQFCDGEKNPSFDVGFERKRGVDMAEIWETSQSAKQKINKLGKSIKK